MKAKIKKVIETLKDDGATDAKSMLDALCDGQYLSTKKWSKRIVDDAYRAILDMKIDELFVSAWDNA